jgi:peptidoglycan-associated lipoprotein
MRAPLLVAALSLAALSLTACGGAGRAKGSLASAVESLELARKTGCPHESLPLAEKTYEEAKRLLDEGKYNESEAKSRVARHLAQEAARANGGQPCAAAPTAVSPVTDAFPPEPVVPTSEAEQVEEMRVVYFKYDSAQLTEEAIAGIEMNLRWLRAHPDRQVELGGHCDVRGTAEYNIALSERRAQAVRGYLLKSGVEESGLSVVGYGSEALVSFREDEEGHRLNRRVEFKAR